jgi:predicted phage terminase large subunit-like protein
MSRSATVDGGPLFLDKTEMQDDVYGLSTAKYVICSAGRRSGKTEGAVRKAIKSSLKERKIRSIWIEVSYNQVMKYVENYFLPIMNKLHPDLWDWQITKRELKIMDSSIVFASGDRPDLLVGFGYKYGYVNEAGIQLFEAPTIWNQHIKPMFLDFADSRCFLFGTPRGTIDKNCNENLYYRMYCQGQKGHPLYDPKYQSFKYSSYDNPLLDEEDIRELEKDIDSRLRAQEIRGEFVNVSDVQIINPAWWRYTDKVPEKNIQCTYLSFDTAFEKGDDNAESAITVWQKTDNDFYYIVNCLHGKYEYPELVKKAKAVIEYYKPDFSLIEKKASGHSLIQTLKEELPNHIIREFDPEDRDKIARASAVSPMIEAGRVILLRAGWNIDLVNQCTVFPIADRKDIVDTISQALLYGKKLENAMTANRSHKIPEFEIEGYRI